MTSNKELYDHIIGRSSSNIQGDIDKLLADSHAKLIKCLDNYGSPSESSLKKVQNSDAVKYKDFVLQVSKLLNLDEWQTFELFQLYIKTHFHGSDVQLKDIFDDHSKMEQFKYKILDYYFDERLLLLQVIKCILSLWQDEKCYIKDELSKVINFLASQKFGDVIFKQYLTVVQVSASHSGITDNFSVQVAFAKQNLLEQCGLLEILVLYHRDFEIHSQDVLKYFAVFQRYDFGRRQINNGFYDVDCENIVITIGNLCNLILLQGLELEVLQKMTRPDEHPLSEEKQKLQKIHEICHHLTKHQHHGPVLLAMSIFEVKTNEESTDNAAKYSEIALQLKVFQHLLDTSIQLTEFGYHGLDVLGKSLIYSLIKLVFGTFEESSLQEPFLLISLVSSLVKNNSLSKDFLESDCGISQLAFFAKRLFPYYKSPLLELCQSLCYDDELSGFVYDILDRLNGYTELFGKNDIDEVKPGPETNTWIRNEDRQLPFDNIVLGKGMLGSVMEIESDVRIIHWDMPCSGWKILLHEIDEFLAEPGAFADDVLTRITSTFKLVKSTVMWQSGGDMDRFIHDCLIILQRAQHFCRNGLSMIAACIDLLTACIPINFQGIFEQILQCGFLPAQLLNNNSAFNRNQNTGHFGLYIFPREMELGISDVTQKYLLMLLELLRVPSNHDHQLTTIQRSCLKNNIIFIVKIIFPQLATARFGSISDLEATYDIVLQVFHYITSEHNDITKESSSYLLEIRQILYEQILNEQAGNVLLLLVSSGNLAIEEWNRAKLREQGRLYDAKISNLKHSLSLLYQLLSHSEKGEETFPLHENLCNVVIQQSSQFGSSQGNESVSLLTVIARYVYYHDDTKVTTLATLLLQQLCRLFPMLLSSAFGSDEIVLRIAMQAHLSSPCKPIRLKIAILEFLTIALENQPGLTEALLNISTTSNSEKVLSIPDDSCLKPILDIIDTKKTGGLRNPDTVVASAMQFLCTLWGIQHGNILLVIQKSESFWKNVTIPLDTCNLEMSNDQLDMLSSSLTLIAHEMFRVKSENFDPHLSSCLQSYISLKLFNKITKLCYIPDDIDPSSEHHQLFASKQRVSNSWLLFLIVASRLQPEKSLLHVKTNQTAVIHYLIDLLANWLDAVSLVPVALIEELTTTLNVIIGRWKRDIVGPDEIWQKAAPVMLRLSSYDWGEFKPVVISIFSFCLSISQAAVKSTGSLPWSTISTTMPFICNVLASSVENLFLKDGMTSTEDYTSMAITSLSLLDEFAVCYHDHTIYLHVLREHSIIPLLMRMLSIGLKRKELLKVSQAVLNYFLKLAQYTKLGHSLLSNGISELFCLNIVPPHYEVSTFAQSTAAYDQMRDDKERYLWRHAILVVTALLRNLKHEALDLASSFLGSHKEVLILALRISPRLSCQLAVEESLAVGMFLRELFIKYENDMKAVNGNISEVFKNELTKTYQTVVALLGKRKLLNYLIERPFDENAETILARSRTPSPAFKDNETKVEEEAFSAQAEKVYQLLLDFAVCLTTTMRSLTPPLTGILWRESFDIDGVSALLDLSFTNPSLDESAVACFGTVISLIHFCFKLLQKDGREDRDCSSPSKKFTSQLSTSKTDDFSEMRRQQLTMVIESSLVVILSQASLYLQHPSVEMQAKQLLRRELGSELRHFLHLYCRQMMRRSLILSPGPQEKSQGGTSFKRSPSKLGPLFSDDEPNSIFKIADLFSKQLLKA